jgi:hypothetical protein
VVHAVALPLIINFPVPKAMVRTFEKLEANLNALKMFPSRSRVPFVSVTVPTDVRFPMRVHAPETPLNVIELKETPFDWMVCAVVALKVSTEVADQTGVTLEIAILPDITSVPRLENVNVPSVTVKSRHVRAPIKMMLNVPAWSKNTLSAAVGTEAPDGPPDVVDHTAVLVVFH